MLARIKTALDQRSPAQVTALGLAIVGLLGIFDYLSGYEMSFSIFYLAPIVLVTWYTKKWTAYTLCMICALTWLLVDYASGHGYSHPLIPFWNAGVRLAFFLITAYLLSELKNHLRYEEKQARVDGLTQLFNARAFRELASKTLQAARRYRRPVVLGYIDLDNFKAVNDGAGHAEGDRVLQTVARTLNRCVRASDIAGRMGGDEFAVFMPETERAGTEITFQRIREELLRDMANHGWPVGFSIGVAVFPTAPTTIDQALKRADHLMYRVKQSGKNNIIYEEQSSED